MNETLFLEQFWYNNHELYSFKKYIKEKWILKIFMHIGPDDIRQSALLGSIIWVVQRKTDKVKEPGNSDNKYCM